MNSEDIQKAINKAFATNHVEMTRHFWDELRADEFVLADVRSALDVISDVTDMGQDRLGNPKYEITGPATDGRDISIICSLKETGALLLITVYEANKP